MEPDVEENDGLGELGVLPSEVIISVIAKSHPLDALSFCQVSHAMRSHATHHATELKERLMARAFYFIDSKRPKISIDILQTLVVLFPDSLDIYKELGCSWMDLNKYQKAVEAFKEGVERAGDDPYKLILQAQLRWALGDIAGAWRLSNEGVDKLPSDPRAHHFRGFVQSLTGSGASDRDSQAKEVTDYLLILEKMTDYPRLSIIHNNLGYVYFEMKKYTKAQKHFDMSIKLCPYHVQSYYNKAVCHADQGNITAAIATCQKMWDVNPQHPEAYSLRGWIHIGSGEIAKSVEMYRLAVHHQEHKDAYTVLIYTGALCVLNRFPEAYKTLEHALPIMERKVSHLKAKIAAAISRENERARLSGIFLPPSTPPKCRCTLSSAHPRLPSQAEPSEEDKILVGPNGELLSCPNGLQNHHAEHNIQDIYNGPDSEMELIKYWKTTLISRNSCVSAFYRVRGEMDLALGKFERVKEFYLKSKAAASGHCKVAQARMDTPLLHYCANLNFAEIRQPIVDILIKYHQLRECEDSEKSFRGLRAFIQQQMADSKKDYTLNRTEQIYFLACTAHFLLALFWEDEQFSGLVKQILEFWSTEATLSPENANPRFLVNVLDLVTRLAGGNNVEAILRAATSATEPDNAMIARMIGAVEHLHDAVPEDLDGVEFVDDDGFPIDEEFEDDEEEEEDQEEEEIDLDVD